VSGVRSRGARREVGAWSFECRHQPGGLHVIESLFLVELLELDSGAPVTKPGVPGESSSPLSTGRPSLASVRHQKTSRCGPEGGCRCGRTWRILDQACTAGVDHITRSRGVPLLADAAAEEVVRSFPEIEGEFEIIVDKRGELDHIALRVEMPPGSSQQARQELAEQLHSALRWKTSSIRHRTVELGRFRDTRSRRNGSTISESDSQNRSSLGHRLSRLDLRCRVEMRLLTNCRPVQRGRPREGLMKGSDTKERILQASIDLFYSEGFTRPP